MSFLYNIRTVAKYEAKTLRRSWFFRLFTLGSLFIFTIINIGFFSPIGDESWSLVSIPSSVPLLNLYLLNIGQAIVVIFLAADFLKRDKKLDTNEVLYTRSMSNLEYVIGKTWGILRLFLGLNIVILSIGLLMNVISKNMVVDFGSYIAYLLIISVPTIVFSLGLAFVLMSLLKNQAVTFLLLLGIAALDMFYFWFRMGTIFDYMAFGVPVFKSSVVGFENLSYILNQRLLFFFLGMALVLTTVLLFKRLPQSKLHRGFTIIFLFVFLAGAAFCGYNTYSVYRDGTKFKNLVVETNRIYENKNFTSVSDADITFTHTGETFEASATLKIINDNKVAVDHLFFSLNPSLKVTKVSGGGRELKFTRTNQILDIDRGSPLSPGNTDSLNISWSGSINELFCYPNYTGNINENPYRIELMNVNKRQAFLEENYVLLTPETHWYPVAALNYYPGNPARIKLDFTRYTLRVRKQEGLSAVSQGIKRTRNGYTIFKPGSPLTGLTLAIGNYETDSLKVDSVTYFTHYFKGHDYYKKDLSEIKDTLPTLVSRIMRELETSFSTSYPFNTLSLVEVPVQFYSLPKKNTQTRAEVQPSMVLLPEKLSTIENAGFNKRFTRQKKRMARNNQIRTDKEIKVDLFNDFIKNVFISGENYRFVNGVPSNEPLRYRLGPSFYFFKNNFYSTDFPVINAVFESHLQHLNQQGRDNDFMTGFGALSDNDKANLILKNISFSELLAKNPAADTVRTVLTLKGDWLFNYLRSKAGIWEFKPWFSEYIDSNRFRKIDIRDFNNDVKEKFGFEFYPALDAWFNSKTHPGFLFTQLRATEIIVGDRSRYQVTFVASNPEPVAGIFNISFRTGGQDRRIQTEEIARSGRLISQNIRGMDADEIYGIVFLGPNETKRIGIILDEIPRVLIINTLIAKNIPGVVELPVDDVFKSRNGLKEFSGEETLTSAPSYTDADEIIVDNEDPGFIFSKQNTSSPLKTFLGVKNRNANTYTKVSEWNTPEYWQPVVLTSYFGKYTRSAVYTRGGTGDKSLTWITEITEPGYYDIYCYIGKTIDNVVKTDGEQDDFGRGNGPYKDMHYKVYHDEGVEDIPIDYGTAEGGWNNLGRFYLSKDSARVELTNKSTARIVIGDAIKWVKQ